MWEKIRKRHPRLYDALEIFVLVASIMMLIMALDLYILIKGLYG